MWVGSLELDLLLGDVRSLKQKRSVVRPVVAELKKFGVSVAEAGHLDLHRRALVGVAVVAADPAHCRQVLDSCERAVAGRPELEVLAARQRLHGPDDEEGSGREDRSGSAGGEHLAGSEEPDGSWARDAYGSDDIREGRTWST